MPFDRRNLLRSAAALAAGAALPRLAHTQSKPSSTLSFKLGIASYTFRNFDAAHLIEDMKAIPCTNLNVKDVHLPETPIGEVPARAATFRSAGLDLHSGGTISLQSTDPHDIRSKFEYCKAAGITTMIAAPTHETLPLIEPYVREFDIRVAVHNHGPEDKFFSSPLDVLKDAAKLDPRIGCCIDLGHTMRSGTDVVTALKNAGPRLFDIHIKDLANATEKESQVAVGDGIMPVREIFQQLIRMNYTGNVDLEYEIFPDSPMPGVIKSFAYMRGVLSGLGYKT